MITFTKRPPAPPGHVPIIIQNNKKVLIIDLYFKNKNFGVFWILLFYQSCWCSLLPLICATEKRLTKDLWWFSKIDLYWQIKSFHYFDYFYKKANKDFCQPPPPPGHVPIIIQNNKKVLSIDLYFTNKNFRIFKILLFCQSCWCSLLLLICAAEKRLTKDLWWFSKIDLYWQI